MRGCLIHRHRSPLQVESLAAGAGLQQSSHLILCHPLLLLPATPPSIRVFINNNGQMWFADSVNTLRHCMEYDLLESDSGLYQELQHPEAVL